MLVEIHFWIQINFISVLSDKEDELKVPQQWTIHFRFLFISVNGYKLHNLSLTFSILNWDSLNNNKIITLDDNFCLFIWGIGKEAKNIEIIFFAIFCHVINGFLRSSLHNCTFLLLKIIRQTFSIHVIKCVPKKLIVKSYLA